MPVYMQLHESPLASPVCELSRLAEGEQKWVMLPRPLLFWESPSDAGSSLCLNEALGSRLIISNSQCRLAALLKAKPRVNDKVFFRSLESTCSQTAFLFTAPPFTAHGGFVYVRLFKKKKSTCYLRAGLINPEEDLLECKSKALFSWIVLQCLESKSIMLSLQRSNISKEFGNFAIHHSL